MEITIPNINSIKNYEEELTYKKYQNYINEFHLKESNKEINPKNTNYNNLNELNIENSSIDIIDESDKNNNNIFMVKESDNFYYSKKFLAKKRKNVEENENEFLENIKKEEEEFL